MCLSRVDNETGRWTVGYKVFKLKGKNLLSEYKHNCSDLFHGSDWYMFETEVWVTDTSEGEIGNTLGLYYPKGFHFYKHKSDAEADCDSGYVVKKIFVQDVVATGKQYGIKVGVAKHIFIND